jgi:hypothetical protein
MQAKELKELVILPTLQVLEKHLDIVCTNAAVKLLLGTAAQESKLGQYLRQIGTTGDKGGFGLYQMELATHWDIFNNFLLYKKKYNLILAALNINIYPLRAKDNLICNMFYSTAMARIHYIRAPEPIPDSIEEIAAYWKKYYNTSKGKGTIQEFINNFNKLCYEAF